MTVSFNHKNTDSDNVQIVPVYQISVSRDCVSSQLYLRMWTVSSCKKWMMNGADVSHVTYISSLECRYIAVTVSRSVNAGFLVMDCNILIIGLIHLLMIEAMKSVSISVVAAVCLIISTVCEKLTVLIDNHT